MGQNNHATEHGDSQGQQGGQVEIPESERKRQASYAPVGGRGASQYRIEKNAVRSKMTGPKGESVVDNPE